MCIWIFTKLWYNLTWRGIKTTTILSAKSALSWDIRCDADAMTDHLAF